MRILSGVQSSGKLHIGNYFGAIRQFIELQDQGESLYFIANLHAMTTVRDAAKLWSLTLDAALDYLALGLDPKKATLFKQSDIPEVTELFWYLTALAPMGLLERAVSYKDKLEKGLAPEVGIFTYPILMAADILLYGTDVVPVGKDQIQHIEIARDLATKFNLAYVAGYDPKRDNDPKTRKFEPILKLPQPHIHQSSAVVPGTDGLKMSKSYGNTIDLFADDAATKKAIMSIKSDSTPLESPKDPKATPIYDLMKLFANESEMKEVDRSFAEGGKGWGHYKIELLDLFHARFDDARARRRELEKDLGYVDGVLREGARKAREYADPIIAKCREAVGMR